MSEGRRHSVGRPTELSGDKTPRSLFARRGDSRRASDRLLDAYTDVQGNEALRKEMARGALGAMLDIEVQGDTRFPGSDRRIENRPTVDTLGIPPQLIDDEP